MLCEFSRYTGRESPCLLLNIPDGHAKEMPTTGSKHKSTAVKEASPVSAKKALSAKEVFNLSCALILQLIILVIICCVYRHYEYLGYPGNPYAKHC